MNKENFELVLNKIKTDPDQWDQGRWHCGTVHCFTGWAQTLSTGKEDIGTIRTDVMVFLDISSKDFDYLSSLKRTLLDFQEYLNLDGRYDSGGYDIEGYDRDGYNLDGYSRDGYNRDGHTTRTD